MSTSWYTVESATTKRVFFICERCKHKITRDYTDEVRRIDGIGGGILKTVYRIDENGVEVGLYLEANGTYCKCGKQMISRELLTRVKSDSVRCTASCQRSTSIDCVCECGGEKHGRAHLSGNAR